MHKKGACRLSCNNRGRILIRGAWVLPVTMHPIKDGCVVIENDKIAYVGPLNARITSACHVKEYLTGIVMPGFVNAHAHLNYSLLRGRIDLDSPLEVLDQISRLKRLLNTYDLIRSAYAGSAECIRTGISTIANVVDPTHPMIAHVSIELGLRTVGFLSIRNRHSTREIDEILHTMMDHPLSSQLLYPGIIPHSLYLVAPERLRECVLYAKERQLPLSIHLAELVAEEAFFNQGEHQTLVGQKLAAFYKGKPHSLRSSVSAAAECDFLCPRTLAVHCIQVDLEDIAILKKTSCNVCLCPRSNVRMGNGFPPVHLMVSENLNLCLGTDSAATCDTYDMFEEMRWLFLGARAVNPEAVPLSAEAIVGFATINGARALGLEAVTGSLEVGKQADLIVVDTGEPHCAGFVDPFDTIVFGCRSSDVNMTMVDGRILWEKGDSERRILLDPRGQAEPTLKKRDAAR